MFVINHGLVVGIGTVYFVLIFTWHKWSSASGQSRFIVGSIHLLAALTDIDIVIRHIPGCLSIGDLFSSPSQAEKAANAKRIAHKYCAQEASMNCTF